MNARSGEREAGSARIVVGVLIVVLAAGMALAAVVVGIVAHVDWAPTTRLLVTAVVYAPVAAVILPYRRPWLAAILAALALTSGAVALVIVLRGGVVDLGDHAPWLVPVVAALARQAEIAAIAILPWLLVRSRRALRTGLVAGGAAISVDLAASAASFSGATLPRWGATVSLAIALVSMLAATVVLVGRWRRGGVRERTVLTWFATGAVLLVLSYSRLLVDLPPLPSALADAAFLVAQSLLPTALLSLAFDPAARGRRGVLFTTVVWAQSLAFATALYLVVYAVAVEVGVPAAPAGAVAAAALALAFAAMRGFIVERTARLYFGPGADALTVLHRLGDGLGRAEPVANGMRGLAQSLQAVWGLSSVRFVLAGDTEPVVVGIPGPASVSAELVARGTRIGVVELSADDAADLDGSVAPVLDEVAPLIAVAVLLATVNQEVETVRSRTLGVRGEERRMLHRELHDELVPSLAGVGFAMAGAERVIAARDLTAAEEALSAIRREVAERAEDIRVLARSLLPAALDSGDLDGALRELARRFTGDGGTVAVRAPGVDVLDARLQVAVYMTVAEALSGLRRAGRRQIGIAVDLADAAVIVRIHSTGDVPASLREEVSDAATRGAADVGGAVEQRTEQAGVLWEAVIPR